MPRRRHLPIEERTSDFDRWSQYFGKSQSRFNTSLPGVDDVLIQHYQIGKSQYLSPELNPKSFGSPVSLQAFDGYIPCANPDCYHGGFRFDQEITEMVRHKAESREGEKHCPGNEAYDKGKRPGLQCLNSLRYRITIRYKPS